VSRRAVGPRWHDDNDNVLFYESPARARYQRQTIAAWLPAFVYLKRAGKQRFVLAASARIDLG
jgi:hypothetical protein